MLSWRRLHVLTIRSMYVFRQLEAIVIGKLLMHYSNRLSNHGFFTKISFRSTQYDVDKMDRQITHEMQS